MASGPIASWKTDGENVEIVSDFTFLSCKINTDGDYNHKIKRCLHRGRITTTNLDSVWKSRDISLLTKVRTVKAMVFPIVMYGCESWTMKAECRRIDAFKRWCWRRPSESLGQQGDQTSRSYRKSILNIHCKDWHWSWSFNTLATWCEQLTHWKRPWCWERLRARGEVGNRGWDGWMVSLTQWTRVWANSGRQ